MTTAPQPAHDRKTAPAGTDHFVSVSLALQGATMMPNGIEMERQKAIAGLLSSSQFSVDGLDGPYGLTLRLSGFDFCLEISGDVGRKDAKIPVETLASALSKYSVLCQEFDTAGRAGQIRKLERLDGERRKIHDEAAEILIKNLQNHAKLDKPTASRLFTLAYVLHMRLLPPT